MKRRSHNQGSVYRRAVDGLFVATVRLGEGTDGKSRRLYGYATTESEAKEILARLLLQADPVRDLSGDTLMSAYLDRWLNYGVRSRVAEGSLVFLKYLARRKLVPVLGKVPMNDLKPDVVQNAYTKLEQAGASAKTRFHCHMALKWACTYAVRWGLLSQNPCSLVVPPRAVNSRVAVLSEDEIRRFLVAAADDRHYALYVTALSTGLRKGELFGLRWQHIDLKHKRLSVRLRADLHTHEDAVVKSPKGERVVALPKFTTDVLRRHRKQLLASGYEGDRVFVTANHAPLRDFSFTTRSFRRVLDKASIDKLKFHQLRHTCAAILLSMDVPIRQVSETLGHSRPQFTLDTYGHLIPGLEHMAVEQLEQVFKGF